jgi:hypothetical protein
MSNATRRRLAVVLLLGLSAVQSACPGWFWRHERREERRDDRQDDRYERRDDRQGDRHERRDDRRERY